jgi:hypothetical protein
MEEERKSEKMVPFLVLYLLGLCFDFGGEFEGELDSQVSHIFKHLL